MTPNPHPEVRAVDSRVVLVIVCVAMGLLAILGMCEEPFQVW